MKAKEMPLELPTPERDTGITSYIKRKNASLMMEIFGSLSLPFKCILQSA